jgi:hypothetical protein
MGPRVSALGSSNMENNLTVTSKELGGTFIAAKRCGMPRALSVRHPVIARGLEHLSTEPSEGSAEGAPLALNSLLEAASFLLFDAKIGDSQCIFRKGFSRDAIAFSGSGQSPSDRLSVP